jgi:hypothetical protein
MNERTLINLHKVRHAGGEARGQKLGKDFPKAMHKANRPKITHLHGFILFGMENHQSLIK